MKQLILIILLAFSINAYTQDDKVVTLVVNGQGKTKDEAKQNALRSAIEQVFGAFVSSKTEILNDSLVKDEIVSVANGNIQQFNIISEVQIPNGDYTTSLKATVSVTKLTAFVESKGVIAEFKGNILAANVKQQILNEQNEIKSIENIVNTCKEILDLSCDFELVRGEPKQKNNDNNIWAVPVKINVLFNKNIEQFTQYFMNSLKGICMSSEEVKQYNKLGKKTYKIALGDGSKIGGVSDDIEFLEKIAKSNLNIDYKIINRNTDEILFESDYFKAVNREFKQLSESYGFKYEIQYFDKLNKMTDPVYHFRTMSSVISIIDLINYTKHSVLNFQISNGISNHIPENLIDFETYQGVEKIIRAKGYGFKVSEENLTPILNHLGLCHYIDENGVTKDYYISDGASVLVGKDRSGNINNISIVDFYEKKVKYERKYYFNDLRLFNKIYYTKFCFLPLARNYLSLIAKDENFNLYEDGYKAVISLFDYKSDGKKVISFSYDDILTLSEIEKVQEYKISPIF